MGKAQRYLRNLKGLLDDVHTPHGRGKNCVGLLGIKSDSNSSFLKGCAGAPERIREALTCGSANECTEGGKEITIRPVADHAANEELATVLAREQDMTMPSAYNVIDLGDLEFDKEDERDPEVFFNSIVELATMLNAKNITPITLGGDHAITYPLFYGLATSARKNIGHIDSGSTTGGDWVEEGDDGESSILPAIVHFDAHPDMYPDFEGNKYSHASPFARIMESKLTSKITQYGIRCGNVVQNNFLRDYPFVDQVTMDQFHAMTPSERERSIYNAIRHSRHTSELRAKTYLSIDIDVLDPSFAPGISHHEPGGMSTRDLLHMIQSIPNNTHFMGADIVEYNPSRDVNGVTAMVAAKILKEVIPKVSMRLGAPARVKGGQKKQGLPWPWKRSDAGSPHSEERVIVDN